MPRPEDYPARRATVGLIMLSAFVTALCLWALWQAYA
jgi:hypothetical protein